MRILLGLICICIMTVAFSGCDDETQVEDQSAAPAAEQAIPQQEADSAVPVAELVPVQPTGAEPVSVQPEEPAPIPMAPDAVVVTVNGTPITNAVILEEVNKRVEVMKQRMPAGQEMPEAQKQQVRMSVEDMLVQKMVLEQELNKRSITISDEKVMEEIVKIAETNGQSLDQVKAEIAQYGMTFDDLKSQVRPQVEMMALAEACQKDPQMQAEAKKFYDENPSYFQVPEQVQASHILLGKRGVTPEEKPEYLEKIKDVEAKLKAGENFEDLAKAYSTCPSSEKGGDLGFFGKGLMDPAFEKAAFELEVGQTSGIVESSFGYHIIKVTDKQEAGTTPFEEAQEKITSYLLQKQMRENATIEYSEAEQAMRQKAQQQQQMQQQMMQQIQAQMAQQQAQQASQDTATESAAQPAEE
ncbi:MAG: peptidylprolyl isomerase [Phycisphaerae bacterium]|nr:peptidylprolyl isomerase [Phycisphaerae bacterium]